MVNSINVLKQKKNHSKIFLLKTFLHFNFISKRVQFIYFFDRP